MSHRHVAILDLLRTTILIQWRQFTVAAPKLQVCLMIENTYSVSQRQTKCNTNYIRIF